MVNKTAIMQPYFFPYHGYFQLMSIVDNFIVYDNVKYTKKGWINRNRLVSKDGKAFHITMPLKKDSDFLDINQRQLSDLDEFYKQINRIEQNYAICPYKNNLKKILMQTFESIDKSDLSLFKILFKSIQIIKEYLDIDTNIIISSLIDIDHEKKSQEKVISLCKKINTNEYINSIGGKDLYSYNDFANEGMELKFLIPTTVEYKQHNNPNLFIPNLSILDMIANMPRQEIIKIIKSEISYL